MDAALMNEYLTSTGRVRTKLMAELRKWLKTEEVPAELLNKTELLTCAFRIQNVIDCPELRQATQALVSGDELFAACVQILRNLLPSVTACFMGSAEKENELIVVLKNLVDIVNELNDVSQVWKLTPNFKADLEVVLKSVVVPRDATSFAALLFVHLVTAGGADGISEFSELAKLGVVRARMQLTTEPDHHEFFEYFVSFLPPKMPNASDERMVHYALSSLLVLMALQRSPITDAQITSLLPCICATIGHPVNMVAAIADNVMNKLVAVASETQKTAILAEVLKTLDVGRARNLLLMSLVQEVAASPWSHILEALQQILSDSAAASSGGSLIAAVCAVSEAVRQGLAERLIGLIRGRSELSARAVDRLFSSLKNCGNDVISDVISRASSLALPIRVAICRLARSRGVAEWRDGVGLTSSSGAILLTVAEIQTALVSSNISLALDAVGVVILTLRTTEIPSVSELHLVDLFIRGGGLFHASAIIDCRTKAVQTIQFFLVRVKAISSSNNKRHQALVDAQAVTNFLTVIRNFFVQVVACVTSSLEASQPSAELLLDLADDLTDEEVRLLIDHGLNSPWERTRQTLAQVLTCRVKNSGLSSELRNSLTSSSLPTLLESRRAQDVLAVEIVVECLLTREDASSLALCRGLVSKALAVSKAGGISFTELAAVRATLRFSPSEGGNLTCVGRALMEIAEAKLAPLSGSAADCRGHALSGGATDCLGENSWVGGQIALETLAELAISVDREGISDLLGRCLLLLLSVKHLGALDALQQAVVKLGEHGGLEVCGSWLDCLLDLLIGNSNAKNLPLPPALRRSHGLGLALCALIRSEISVCPRAGCATLLERCVTVLSRYVRGNISLESSDSSVHAVNMLHTLVRHASLTRAVNRYVPDLFELAALCMQATCWKLRTAGNLLFVNCARRLVGGDDELNAKAVPVAEFFARYPSLVEVLLALTAAERPETALAGLLVITRLQAHASEWPGKLRFLAIFWESLRSPVWQVRQVAGRLLIRSGGRGVTDVLRVLAATASANEAHGCLMALTYAVGTGQLRLPSPDAVADILTKAGTRFAACPVIISAVAAVAGAANCGSPVVVEALGTSFRTPVFAVVASGDLRSCDAQTLRQSLDDELASGSLKSEISKFVFSREFQSDPIVSRELRRSALPWTKIEDPNALAREWREAGFIEGVKSLVHHCPEVSDPGVLRYLAAQEDDAEARWLAAAGRDVAALPVDLAATLVLDENLDVRLAASAGVNTVQTLKVLLAGADDAECVRKLVFVRDASEDAGTRASTRFYEKEPEGMYTERWVLDKVDLFRTI